MSAKGAPREIANSLHHYIVAFSLFKFEERQMSLQIDTSSNIIMMIGELFDCFGKMGPLKSKE